MSEPRLDLATGEWVIIAAELSAYRARYRAMRHDPGTRLIIIFKNRGEQAGTSLSHPHSQEATAAHLRELAAVEEAG